MLLIEVTGIKSGHRGQVTKGQNMNQILIRPCDACFMANFSFPAQWCWLDDYQRRLRILSGKSQVKVRLRSGQRRSNFKVNIFCKKGYLFDAAYHGKSNGDLRFVIHGQQQHTKELECLTSLTLSSFLPQLCQNRIIKLRFGMPIAD